MQTQEWTKIYRWGEGKRKIYLRIQKNPQKTNQPTTHLFVITVDIPLLCMMRMMQEPTRLEK